MPREQLNNYEGAYRIRVLIGVGLAYEREKFLGPWATLQGAKNIVRQWDDKYNKVIIEKISGDWEEVK